MSPLFIIYSFLTGINFSIAIGLIESSPTARVVNTIAVLVWLLVWLVDFS